MSTIRVNAIQSTSTTDGGISIDNSGHVTVDGVAYPSAGPLSNRNLVINGGMQVNQRPTSTSFTATSNGFVVDRFYLNVAHGAFTVSQSTDAPSGFANSLKWDCTTSASEGSSGETYVEQKIEAQNLQNLAYGTSSAKSFMLSFWVKSNLTGNFGLWVESQDASRYYASAGYTINSADTWEYKTITVPGDTAGTGINNDNGIGFKIRFYLVANTTLQGTPAESWGTSAATRVSSSMVNLASSTDNEFFLTGVQLEVGSVATPFEHRSFGDELRRCQRYYQRIASDSNSDPIGIGYNEGTTEAKVMIDFPVTMRTPPSSLEQTGTASDYEVRSGSTTNCSSVPAIGPATKNNITIIFTVSGLTDKVANQCRFRISDIYLAWSAEL